MRSASLAGRVAGAALALLVAGCASTRIEMQPEGSLPSLCVPAPGGGLTQVTWWPRWRTDQKEPAAREAVADAGLRRVVTEGRCLAPATFRRRPTAPQAGEEIQADGEG